MAKHTAAARKRPAANEHRDDRKLAQERERQGRNAASSSAVAHDKDEVDRRVRRQEIAAAAQAVVEAERAALDRWAALAKLVIASDDETLDPPSGLMGYADEIRAEGVVLEGMGHAIEPDIRGWLIERLPIEASGLRSAEEVRHAFEMRLVPPPPDVPRATLATVIAVERGASVRAVTGGSDSAAYRDFHRTTSVGEARAPLRNVVPRSLPRLQDEARRDAARMKLQHETIQAYVERLRNVRNTSS